MAKDVNDHVLSCSVCAQAKVPCNFPVGKLDKPLENPQRPWSHIAIDFLTDLLESEGKTMIMVVMDQFSRAIKLLPLNVLHSIWLCWNYISTSFLLLWYNRGHCVWSWPSIHITSIAGIYGKAWSYSKPHIWISSPVQQPNWETKPGDWALPSALITNVMGLNISYG